VQRFSGVISLGLVAVFAAAVAPVAASRETASQQRQTPERVTGPAHPDLSAQERHGRASYYAREFFGRPMADGAPMDPGGRNAASRTLPLGTVAKVTNVDTGKSAIVKIEDRGPYIKGRIVDLSPATATKIGITPRIGVAKVVVAPLAVPLPDGSVKLGPAAVHDHVPTAPTPRRRPAPQAMARAASRSGQEAPAQRPVP
jgi:rare lipoprotein A